MSRFFITRALVVTAVLVLVAIAHSVLATTWVTWVPFQTASPSTSSVTVSSGASVSGTAVKGYWGGVSFMYSTQAVTWITPSMNTLGTATYDQIQNYLGTSGAALWVVFSSQSVDSNRFLYQGTVTASAVVSIGSSYTFSTSTGYQGYAAFAVINVPSKTCGQLYFQAGVTAGVSNFNYYFVFMFGNSTWFYIEFYAINPLNTVGENAVVAGPNTCLTPGYYLYTVTVYVSGSGTLTIAGTAQVSINTTSTGAQYVPGTQYALKIAPASGDVMVFPWTILANPYVKLIFTQNITNTAGNPAPGSFNVTVSGSTYTVSNAYQLLYFSDNKTNTFPTGGQITPINCPSGVYELSTTVSTSVPKILGCQSISSPSAGSVVYPGDYAKYTSTATTFTVLPIPSGSATATFTVSYTDSTNNAYSATISTNRLAVYISSFSITPSTSDYVDYVHNPSITAGGTYYVPVPTTGWAYVGPEYLTSPSISGSTNITISSYLLASVSTYPSVTLNTTALRLPLSSSVTSYTIAFYNVSGDAETIGITPNGVGVYFSVSNETTYTVPPTPHVSKLLIPLGTAFIGGSLSSFWNATTIEAYNATMVNGTGSTGPFTIKLGGVSVTASEFSWNITNPPNAITTFTGVDGRTYAFNPAWVQSLGITKILVGGSAYFVPTVIGKILTSTNLAFIAQGVWLNETVVNNSFMTYYPLPSFINFLNTPIYMYVNGTTSPRYLTPALAIINNNLQQYTVQYMNITAWSNVGSLMGVAIIKMPFSFIGFVSNDSLAPIFMFLNGTVGVPAILLSYYPQIRYLYMPDTATTPYSLLQVAVNVPSQLFNQWSGNLVFGVSQAMPNGYYALVSGGFYAPPPTQFNLYVPSYLLNKLAQLFLASYPQSSTCVMLQILSNPLDTTICQGISQVVSINLGQTQVGKPAFGDVAGAFNIAPLVRNLTPEQIIAINAATAALVIIFVKKHQSLPAGLMLGGAICLAIGIFLWLAMEIGIGILLLVAGAALATTHRTQ